MATVQEIFPLSPLQQGMLFHSLYTPVNGVYVEQRWCVIEGDLDVAAFQQAWNQVINRHSALRAEFHWDETEQPVQAVYDSVVPEWLMKEFGAPPLHEYLEKDRQRGFELDRAPLMRFALFRIGPDRYHFVWTYHHLLMDGWCNAVLIQEVLAAYETAKNNSPQIESVLKHSHSFPYRNYIDWLQKRPTEPDDTYWRQTLAGIEQPTHLTAGIARPGLDSHTAEEYSETVKKLDVSVTEQIQAFAKVQRLTLNTLIQGVWSLLLHRYCSGDDVIFGATISGRPAELSGIETAVGLFINTVPVRVAIDRQALLTDWLQQIQQEQRSRENHGYGRLLDLQAMTKIPSGVPLFDSLLVFENYPVSIDEALESRDRQIKLVERDGYERTNYPLTLIVIPGSQLTISVRYESEKFSLTIIERLLAQLQATLQHVADNDQQLVGKVPVLPSEELEQLVTWGTGPQTTVEPVAIHEQFRRQARQHPQKEALVFQSSVAEPACRISYEQLDQLSDRLASLLSQRGIGRGARVGVFLERSPALITALLGVLKSGAAYVPLDQDYPASRLQLMARDAELDLLLHDADEKEVREIFSNEVLSSAADRCECLAISLAQIAALSPGGPVPIAEASDPRDLAYIIYTSGSTGHPKGVSINHANLTNFLAAMANQPGMSQDDVLLAVTTVSFDIAVLELFLPLVTGAEIVLATSQAARDGQELARMIKENCVTVMQATPATWRLLLNAENVNSTSAEHKLKILCGGEALDTALAHQLLNCGSELWNLYGPTETTIWSGGLRIQPEHLRQGNVPIGNPIFNTQFRVLDRYRQPVPIGSTGELHIGGLGVSPGYWQRPEMTAQRFVDGWYATGDRVRVREDGLLDFLERIDHQVKLRGFRIEIGEIEAALNDYPEVAQAVVVLQGNSDDEKQLVAYLRCRENINLGSLREHLQTKLPSYMVPSQFLSVEAFPLTLNGKVDRKNLAARPFIVEQDSAGQQVLSYSSPEEELLAGIWANVLGLSQVAPRDNFFEIGGHSLTAARVVSRVRQTLSIEVPLRHLFEHPQLNDFAESLDRLAKSETSPIPRLASDQNSLSLSAAQRRQWMLVGLLPDSSLYAIPTAVRLRGKLSVQSLQKSLEHIVAKHETLRMTFHDEGGQPVARVVEHMSVTLPIEDLTRISEADRKTVFRQRMQSLAKRGFDLREAPLWHVELIRLSAEEHVLVWSLHHILVDGWSLGILVRDLAEAYVAAEKNEQPLHAASTVNQQPLLRYSDYAAWQQDQDTSADIAYWRRQLSGLAPLLELPTDFPRPAEQSFEGASYQFWIDEQDLAAIRHLGGQQGTTLFMTLLSVFYVLLYRYSAIDDLAIGTPVANRDRQELEDVVGLFVNTFILRANLAENPTVEELLSQVRQLTLKAYQHQQAPFEQVVDAIGAARSRSASPLFQVLFTLQNAPLHRPLVDGLELSPLTLETQTSKFDLSLSFREEQSRLRGQLEYRTDLFREDTIQRMAKHFCQLLREFPQCEGQRLSSLSMLDDREREQLDDWASTRKTLESTADNATLSIHELFARQAYKTPQAVALKQGETQWTYEELDNCTDQLASVLRDLGVQRETRVGVVANRSPQSIAFLLAILKTGGAYVPLDPTLPEARWRWIVQNAECVIVVSDDSESLEPLLAGSQAEQLQCDIKNLIYWVARLRTSSLEVSSSSGQVLGANLAYMMYTSGSTGTPKGVCTLHQGVTRLVRDANYMTFGTDEVFLQAAPLGFDASTLEIWGPLLNGGTLVIPEMLMPTLDDIADLVEQHQVTSLWLSAGLFHILVDEGLDQRFSSLRHLLAGGDVLSRSHLRKASKVLPQAELINGYGPTEGTTFTCCQTFTEEELKSPTSSPVPIGRPIAATRVYVLDAHLEHVPIGVPGELYLGGKGMARGYWNDSSKTAAHFVPNPFFDIRAAAMNDENLTLYKTGDLVRYRADGVLEFLGRKDQQVKVRGFRIEPGEIESLLKKHNQVRDAVVVAVGQDAQNKRLAAFLVGGQVSDGEYDGRELSTIACTTAETSAFRQHLAEHLSAQLIPSSFQWIPQLPLNSNGKVDRSRLPDQVYVSATEKTKQDATDTEQQLLLIWKSLLPSQEIGLNDNFFDLGGDSIIALQIVSRANRAGLKITPAELFQFQTIVDLARVAKRSTEAVATHLAQPHDRPFHPTPIQSWFLDQQLANPHHFNQSVCVTVPPDIDRAALDLALAKTFEHHDALRLRVKDQQVIYAKESSQPVAWYDVVAEMSEVAQQLQASLHLHQGPTFRVAGFSSSAESKTCLLFVAHHFVIDAVSWRILLEDLHDAYRQAISSETILLPAKTASYQAWAEHLASCADNAEQDYEYWQIQAKQAAPISLPALRGSVEPTDGTIGKSNRVVTKLTAQLTTALVQRGAGDDHPSTLDHLVAALCQSLLPWTAEDKITIELEKHGRSAMPGGIDLDVSRTVGWFTALYPVTLQLPSQATADDWLIEISEQLAAVPHDGLSYGILRYLQGHQELETGASVGFNYLGQLDAVGEATGFERVESPGELIAPENKLVHWLDINCWVVNRAMTIEWAFDNTLFTVEEIRDVSHKFGENIKELLRATTHKNTSTAEQFDLADMDAEQLASVKSQVRFHGMQDKQG